MSFSSLTRPAFRLDASESELTGLGKICLLSNLDLFIHKEDISQLLLKSSDVSVFQEAV
jgi:hypothetical protein